MKRVIVSNRRLIQALVGALMVILVLYFKVSLLYVLVIGVLTGIILEYSLYKENKKNPTLHYSCSKCLACVEKCPAKSLQYKI